MSLISSSRITHVIQGEFHLGKAPGEILGTILGSCVAACVRDPVLGIGGMNHFLLPGSDPNARGNVKYGAHSMERLINAVLRQGAVRHQIEVQLYGGANVLRGLTRIGDANARFARQYVRDEGFRLVAEDMGGNRGRRLRFDPATGRATVDYLDAVDAEIEVARPAVPRPVRSGDVDLF